MLKADQIPPEVVEAAARKFAFYAGYTWGSKGLDHDAIRGEAAMVILSALNAWPGAGRFEDVTGWDVHIELPLLIHLSQEVSDE